MSKQPEALRLANYIEKCDRCGGTKAAAAELRRLHAENEALRGGLETECMRLAACSTAALGYFDGCIDEYKSASLNDVLRLRADYSAKDTLLRQALEALKSVDGTIASLASVLSATPEPGAPADLVRSAITAIQQRLGDTE